VTLCLAILKELGFKKEGNRNYIFYNILEFIYLKSH